MKDFRVLSLAICMILGLPALASTIELKVDDAHSDIGFDVKHLMVSTVHGNFAKFSGTVDLDEKDMTHSKVKFVVRTDSITTGNEKRDGHLKSPDFFDIEKYPEAKFVSTSIKSMGDGKYELVGDLTIHGVTKKAKFTMLSLGAVKDPFGNSKRIFQASTDLNRKDYGLTWNKALESGGVLVGENVKLTINLELNEPQKAQPKAQTAKAN